MSRRKILSAKWAQCEKNPVGKAGVADCENNPVGKAHAAGCEKNPVGKARETRVRKINQIYFSHAKNKSRFIFAGIQKPWPWDQCDFER